MKFTSKVLLALAVILIGALLSSNIILKREYDKVDKSDIYWNYHKILQQPFKYLKITGGNGTRIAFEQSPHYSVRILQEWERYHGGEIKAHITNDTLYVNFDYVPPTPFDFFYIKNTTTIRIFSPELLSFDGFNTNFEMYKLKQKSMNVNLAGRSKFEVESMLRSLDSINVFQRDSSEVVFEMSPDYKPVKSIEKEKSVTMTIGSAPLDMSSSNQIESPEAMSIKTVKADIQGYSLLDLGHAQIDSLQLSIADSSAIIISGGALKKFK
jgi:hypothetical protein